MELYLALELQPQRCAKATEDCDSLHLLILMILSAACSGIALRLASDEWELRQKTASSIFSVIKVDSKLDQLPYQKKSASSTEAAT